MARARYVAARKSSAFLDHDTTNDDSVLNFEPTGVVGLEKIAKHVYQELLTPIVLESFTYPGDNIGGEYTMANRILELLHELQASAGETLKILTDENDSNFQELAKRWTDIDRKTPAAIVLPISEEQIQIVVQWSIRSSIPFVTKSGGHSEWSTIDKTGIVIDLSNYSSIEIDVENQQATLKGSILSKQVSMALADAGLFTALGNSNPVGAIPYFLGGGASVTTSLVGYGADQIVSARMIDTKGNIVDVTEEKESDLLWGLRGAGQFFGLVTQLTIKVHPLAKLGNSHGTIWGGSFVFPLSRADEIASVMEDLMNDSRHATAGLMMIMAPPPNLQPALVVAARYIGNPNDAETALKPLYNLQPLVANGASVPIQNISDGREAFNAKGGFKRFGTIGLHQFEKAAFLKVTSLWQDLVKECPDAITTSFNFQWDSRPSPTPQFDSATSLHDIRFWQNNFIWHTDPASRQRVDDYNKEAMAAMRGTDRTDYVDFPNATRVGPIEFRYRGEGKLGRLRALKKRWDPTGMFTRQLLD